MNLTLPRYEPQYPSNLLEPPKEIPELQLHVCVASDGCLLMPSAVRQEFLHS